MLVGSGSQKNSYKTAGTFKICSRGRILGLFGTEVLLLALEHDSNGVCLRSRRRARSVSYCLYGMVSEKNSYKEAGSFKMGGARSCDRIMGQFDKEVLLLALEPC